MRGFNVSESRFWPGSSLHCSSFGTQRTMVDNDDGSLIHMNLLLIKRIES